jgi:hypothetical protein
MAGSVSQPASRAVALLTPGRCARRVGRMSFLGKAIFAFWADVEASGEVDYVDWHNREHMPERCAVPGFLRGRRHVAVAAAPKYFMMYETETLETLASPAYVERLNNPTPWTRKCLRSSGTPIARRAGRPRPSDAASEALSPPSGWARRAAVKTRFTAGSGTAPEFSSAPSLRLQRALASVGGSTPTCSF